jgi:hypothetical protein
MRRIHEDDNRWPQRGGVATAAMEAYQRIEYYDWAPIAMEESLLECGVRLFELRSRSHTPPENLASLRRDADQLQFFGVRVERIHENSIAPNYR